MEKGNKVRFTYILPGNTRPSTLEGKITAFMFKSQRAIIEYRDGKETATATVPIADIIRVIG